MDKRLLKKWSIIGVFFVFVLASGWHFLYSDVVKCGITAVVAPVNESPWEHSKLFFVPAIIWYAIMYFIAGRKFPNYVFSHAIALLVMPAVMLLLFYGYTLFVPDNLPLDIIESFIVVAFGQFVGYKLTVSKLKLSGTGFIIAAAVIVLGMLAVYIAFTYSPLHWGPMQDPTDMHYGI